MHFCIKRKLFTVNIVEDLESTPNASEPNQKSPFMSAGAHEKIWHEPIRPEEQ